MLTLSVCEFATTTGFHGCYELARDQCRKSILPQSFAILALDLS